jgi:hypothetical protein
MVRSSGFARTSGFFLQEVRKDPRLQDTQYWIDSLCIDQNGNGSSGQQEKNHQVDMMGTIYQNATEVISWLGKPHPSMTPALSYLEKCFVDWGKKGHESSYLVGASAKNLKKVHNAFSYITCSRYWTRIWVVQEVAKATKVRLRFGLFEIPWYNDMSSLFGPYMSEDERMFVDTVAQWESYRSSRYEVSIHDMCEELSNMECYDPRDKIYALLSIMHKPPVQANYFITCEQLYETLVRNLLKDKMFLNPGPDRLYGYSKSGQELSCSREGSCSLILNLRVALKLSDEATSSVLKRVARSEKFDWVDFHPFTKVCEHYDPNMNCLVGHRQYLGTRNLKVENLRTNPRTKWTIWRSKSNIALNTM